MNSQILDQLVKQAYQEFQLAISSTIKSINTPACIFDIFFKKCQQYHDQPVHNFQEMRAISSTKSKGDLFELFCARYLMAIKGFEKVWLLKELSEELKRELKLPLGNKDYGIDLVCYDGKGSPSYSAVQCKFKTPRPPVQVKNSKNETKTIYPCVNWKELSTFNELCNASGPWKQRITMTTAPSVRRLGGIKDPKDKSICLQSLKSISPENWVKLMGGTPHQNHLSTTAPVPVITEVETDEMTPVAKIPIKLKTAIMRVELPLLSQQELREKRLLFYSKGK